ncbi:putative 37S ribosomal protein S11 [Aspergillus ellipticus CBS 707.79]|uniref:Putative 37S ribosomal protein S11 n=1 Tax=Aspergillus ellipticus CBS 707.79 TaxID=1448320 RepID=A0A319CX52_9EURO|nr:putative 37S ribosomal protein S11 [Aspergillus ellipticus CBS 707.79]
MNSTFVTALTRALPSIGRSSQLRAPAFRLTRPFSSTPAPRVDNPRDSPIPDISKMTENLDTQGIKPNPLGRQSAASAEQDSITAIRNVLGVNTNRKPRTPTSHDFNKMAESLEAEMIKLPYADRSPPHHLHIYTHRHNLHLTLTRPNGNPLISMSCGQLGFRKTKRGGFDAAYQLTAHVFGQIQERGLLPEIQRLELVFRGFNIGREAFVKVLLGNEGRNIRGLVCRVTDSTRIKFGGNRSRATRRLG